MMHCEKCGNDFTCNRGAFVSHQRWCGVPFNEAEFWDSMERLPWSGCWIWTKASLHYGYGGVQWFPTPDAKRVLTGIHRVAWTLTYGPIPKGMHVLHKCDVTACGNPEHLRLGTHMANMMDKMARGRIQSKLKADDVRAIRLSPLPSKELAVQYGVGYSAIWAVRTGRKWSHLK
jgi:hypothetical protein